MSRLPAFALVVLAIGQTAEIAPSTTLRFERIVNDSRCPADVQCVWAGEVRIALALNSPGGSTGFELSSHFDNKATVQSFAVVFESFGPCPARAAGGAPAGECASLRVSPDSAR